MRAGQHTPRCTTEWPLSATHLRRERLRPTSTQHITSRGHIPLARPAWLAGLPTVVSGSGELRWASHATTPTACGVPGRILSSRRRIGWVRDPRLCYPSPRPALRRAAAIRNCRWSNCRNRTAGSTRSRTLLGRTTRFPPTTRQMRIHARNPLQRARAHASTPRGIQAIAGRATHPATGHVLVGSACNARPFRGSPARRALPRECHRIP